MTAKREPEKEPCPRCGFERVVRLRGLLCADCRDVLTSEERAVWNPRYVSRKTKAEQQEQEQPRELVGAGTVTASTRLTNIDVSFRGNRRRVA